MLEPITFSSFKTLSLEETERIREYRTKNPVIHPKAIFVKKPIKKTEWERDYKWQESYCNLGVNDEGKVIVGFVVANEVPVGCERLTDEELRSYDDWARGRSYAPLPLKINLEIK
jgi:hypothetical protein